jgi:RNA polymerase sigma-70 factor (sigma-E family)
MAMAVRGAKFVAGEDAVPVDADSVLSRVYVADGPALVGLARLLLDDRGQAEDVVQEAFVRTYAGWWRVRDRSDPLPYVRRTVVNLARGGLRSRRAARRRRLDPVGEALSAEAVAEERARDERLAAAVRELPRRQRECVVLRYYADCSVAQTAASLGISVGAVKQHVHRALGALARAVDEGAQ